MQISSVENSATTSNIVLWIACILEAVSIAKFIFKTDKESFDGVPNEWIDKWSDFFKEHTIDNMTSKSHYAHKRFRSSYLSIKM